MIDELVAAGTPIDAADAVYRRQALRVAARNGRRKVFGNCSSTGADPNLKTRGRTALDQCQPANRYLENPTHAEVDAILRRFTAS